MKFLVELDDYTISSLESEIAILESMLFEEESTTEKKGIFKRIVSKIGELLSKLRKKKQVLVDKGDKKEAEKIQDKIDILEVKQTKTKSKWESLKDKLSKMTDKDEQLSAKEKALDKRIEAKKKDEERKKRAESLKAKEKEHFGEKKGLIDRVSSMLGNTKEDEAKAKAKLNKKK